MRTVKVFRVEVRLTGRIDLVVISLLSFLLATCGL